MTNRTIFERTKTILGYGATSTVYLSVNMETGSLCATKVIHDSCATPPESDFLTVDHPNLLKIFSVTTDPIHDETVVVMEHLPLSLGILQRSLPSAKLPEKLIRAYVSGTLKGLTVLHKRGTVHSDVKPENILLDSCGGAKLGDFGSCLSIADAADCDTLRGTPCYMAPEIVLQEGFSTAADMWSLGCVMITLAGGRPPFHQSRNPAAAMYRVGTDPSSIFEEIPSDVSPELRDAIKACVQGAPEVRATAVSLQQYPFFKTPVPVLAEPSDDKPTVFSSHFDPCVE